MVFLSLVLVWARRAGRSIATRLAGRLSAAAAPQQRRANAGNATLSADVGS